MRNEWFWKWFEKKLQKSEHKNGLVVKIVVFLNRKKTRKREENFRQLTNLYHKAKEEMDEKEFFSFLTSAYFNLTGKISEIEFKLLEHRLNLATNTPSDSPEGS